MTRVLICDDAVAFGVLFTRWMADAGLSDVSHASTAGEALALAGRLAPEVIVVDHLLPDASSVDLVPRLREASPEARILLISGMPSDHLARQAEAVGADGYITKASTADAMRDAVTRLLG